MDHQLSELPRLSKLYLMAATSAAKQCLIPSRLQLSLPARAKEVRGVTADLRKATEFAHLMGESARDVLPSGYVHALAFPLTMSVMVEDDFPLPLLGMIHLRNHVEHHAAIHFDDVLTIRAWARGLLGHRRGTVVQMVTEVYSSDGHKLLWREVSTYLAKGVLLPNVNKPLATVAHQRVPFRPPRPTAQWKLGVDTGRSYAGVSGDFNPIHLSTLTAKALGQRRSMAHGMYAASRVLSDIGTHNSEAFTWEISFANPMFLPTLVSLHVTDKETNDAGWLASEFVAWNARSGREHFRGSVHAGIHSESGA